MFGIPVFIAVVFTLSLVAVGLITPPPAPRLQNHKAIMEAVTGVMDMNMLIASSVFPALTR